MDRTITPRATPKHRGSAQSRKGALRTQKEVAPQVGYRGVQGQLVLYVQSVECRRWPRAPRPNRQTHEAPTIKDAFKHTGSIYSKDDTPEPLRVMTMYTMTPWP